jgi:hypothetical protein
MQDGLAMVMVCEREGWRVEMREDNEKMKV